MLNKNPLPLRWVILLFGLSLYGAFLLMHLTQAAPSGANIEYITTDNFSVNPDSRQDLGGKIVTVNLAVTQPNDAWKAYVGNITGTLVLKNSAGLSIYEWSLNSSTLSGTVFVTRAGAVTWGSLRCANSTIIESEQVFLGMGSADTDNINRTFNSTTHKTMTISSGDIQDTSNCPTAYTYINGTRQAESNSAIFQELLLYDTTNLVYGTFIDQDSWAYNNNETNNVTYDFQLIVAENETSPTGNTYYFYADIS